MTKISTPFDMYPQLSNIVVEFEKQLSLEQKGSNHYELFVDGIYISTTCKCIENLYLQAGWGTVACISDYTKNLTFLSLFI